MSLPLHNQSFLCKCVLRKTKDVEHRPLTESTLRRPAILILQNADTLFLDADVNDGFTSLLSVFCYKLIYSYKLIFSYFLKIQSRFLKDVISKGAFSSNYSRRLEPSMASSKIFSNKKITLMSHVCVLKCLSSLNIFCYFL